MDVVNMGDNHCLQTQTHHPSVCIKLAMKCYATTYVMLCKRCNLGGLRYTSGHRDSGHMTSPSNQQLSGVPGSSEAFDYSLRVGNINYSLNDNQVRSNLFREFKRFGYVNIKVIGYGKERHAYINFNRAAAL